jgi:predicted nucleic acid-binding protein
MSDVVIDSSVWIDFFRGAPEVVQRVDALLESGRAAVTGAVFAEVLSGARSRPIFDRLKLLLGALEQLDAPPNAWDEVAELRFAMARQGFQAHLVDLLIAVTARYHSHRLLTRDRDFSAIAKQAGIEIEIV